MHRDRLKRSPDLDEYGIGFVFGTRPEDRKYLAFHGRRAEVLTHLSSFGWPVTGGLGPPREHGGTAGAGALSKATHT